MGTCGGNPGRVGHRLGMASAERVYACREAVASFFGLSDPTGVVFTHNCTTALNTVIHGVLRDGGRAVISDLEHNAVWRPLHGLSRQYPRYDMAAWSADEDEIVENFRRAIRPDTRLMVCTHASNVFGVVFPVRRLAELAHRHGLVFCVDAAQTAGVLPIHMEADGIDLLCVAAHKGLYAPMGCGLLLCRNGVKVHPLTQGGTGSDSLSPHQPETMPDRLESGTPNTGGISGLLAGVQFVERIGRERIYEHETALLRYVYEQLEPCERIRLFTPPPEKGKAAPVLSLQVKGVSCEQVAALLDAQGVAVRAGLHCAPLAHRRFGTVSEGTVRLAPSFFSTAEGARKIAKLFLQIAEKTLHTAENMV